MPSAEVEMYRQHDVWEVLRLKHDALEQARYGNAQIEQQRIVMREILAYALKSKDNSLKPFVYLPVLDELRGLANQIPAEENQFHSFAQNNTPPLAAAVRNLPGPPPRNLPQSYADLLDESIATRTEELAEVRAEIRALRSEIEAQETVLKKRGEIVAQQEKAVTAAKQTIESTAEETESVLNQKYEEHLKSWMDSREEKDRVLDNQLADQVLLLATAALVGQRLVEHAAGNLTAKDWTIRATRERRSGRGLRILAIVFGFLGLGLAFYIVDRAVKQDFDLTVGDGLLRAAAIVAAIAVGGYFAAESRRHYTESDTAEEVAAAMLAIEPYYAGAADDDRTAARNAVGETVFVKNVLSRFTSRDAGRHNEAVSNQDLSTIVDELTKALKAVQATQGPTKK